MAALEIQGQEVSIKELKPLLIPVGAILVVLVLFYFGITQSLDRIKDKRRELTVARRDETTLEQKQEVLSDLSGEITSFVNVSSAAVPEKNASLIMISQIKSLAAQRLLLISDISIGGSAQDGVLSKSSIQFDVEGDFTQVTSFVRDIANSAPLSRIDSVEIRQGGDTVRATVSLSTYGAAFPEKLPPINEPLSDLTDKEREVLGILTELQAPPFSEVTPQEPIQNENPFE